jgi:4-hydroxybenzoate polyprenyltransferase
MVKVDALVWMLCLLRWIFILLLAIIFDTRDIDIDRMRAFHSLATDLNPQLMKIMVKILFLLYTLLLASVLMLGVAIAQAIALALSGIALWMVYRMSLIKRGYYFYYFLVDGVMLFSTIASFVATI